MSDYDFEIVSVQDGKWSEWSVWSLPVGTVLPQKVFRTRTCTNPEPLFGGKKCPGKDKEDKLLKTLEPVDGGWSKWLEWSDPTGFRNPENITRLRTCTNPSPFMGGKDCEGENLEDKLVWRPIDGKWGPWGAWSEPVLDELVEVLTRKRFCNLPAPQHGGVDCIGKDTQNMPYSKRKIFYSFHFFQKLKHHLMLLKR